MRVASPLHFTTNQLGFAGLVVVIVLAVSSLALLSSRQGDGINKLLVDQLTETLARKLEEVSAAQERTDTALTRLIEVIEGDLAAAGSEKQTGTGPEPPAEEKDEDGGPEGPATPPDYPHMAYKKWLAKLGVTSTERSCEDHMGLALVQRFRESKSEWCKKRSGQGRVECYSLPGWGTRGDPDTFCEGFNLVIDFAKIPWNRPAEHDGSGQNKHPPFGPGSFSAQCEIDRVVMRDKNRLFGGGNKLSRAFWNNFVEIPADETTHCDFTFENPVVILMRYEAWNLYHQLGDWLNTFTTLEVVDKLDKNTQVLLLDMHDTTEPYTDIFQAFSTNHSIVLGRELAGKGKVCFRDAIFPWEGYGTFIHNNIWNPTRGEPCVHSDIIEGFSHFILTKLGLLERNIPNKPQITLILRKDYMGRNIDRKFHNEEELVNGLRDVSRGRGAILISSSINVMSPLTMDGIVASFKTVRLDLLTSKEQIELMYTRTNILIGAHGAGLTHTIFLPTEAILIELVPDFGIGLAYFRNLAKQANRIYIPVHTSSIGSSLVVDVKKVQRAMSVAISIASSFNTQAGKQ